MCCYGDQIDWTAHDWKPRLHSSLIRLGVAVSVWHTHTQTHLHTNSQKHTITATQWSTNHANSTDTCGKWIWNIQYVFMCVWPGGTHYRYTPSCCSSIYLIMIWNPTVNCVCYISKHWVSWEEIFHLQSWQLAIETVWVVRLADMATCVLRISHNQGNF